MTQFRQVTAQSRKYKDKIAQILDPLKVHFGIDIFWHYSIQSDGHFMHLSSSPEAMEGYFENGNHLSNPFFKHPKFYKPQAILTNQIRDADYQKTLEFTKKQYKYDRSLLILDQKDDCYHGFGFATTHNPQQLNVLFQDLDLIQKFLKYYRTEMDEVFKKVDDKKIPLAQILGTRFLTPPASNMLGVSKMKRRQFLDAIGHQKRPIKIHLTPREIDCIAWHLQGKTAAQIAERLQLSRRTVEHYMETLKEKLGCRSKTEIYDSIKLLISNGTLEEHVLERS